MDYRKYHVFRQFDSASNWERLSAVMAFHPDWSVEKCKRRLLGGFTIEQIKRQKQ